MRDVSSFGFTHLNAQSHNCMPATLRISGEMPTPQNLHDVNNE